uniref:Uncharacterized protein n=2 Tax=Candidatus Kentrum eta TaxID=2126337 RepID=A0A450U5B8_9GAMM|nr:MAG: hypothetical protein BECKH772A_GA0070896_100019 [Candidatus Kentron sp. H]VFJ95369.1 MAG: hypothetical protein BECKH772C_GA0070978_100029 [Candidatus Kentron sp. H]
MVWFLVPRTANSFDYDPMRNQWIVADFNTANLQLGVLVAHSILILGLGKAISGHMQGAHAQE